MRILMVVRPAAGGMKEHVLALAEGVSAAGHEVEFAAPAGSDVALAATASGHRVHPIPLVGPLHPVHDPAAVWALRRIVREGRFDVIHAHGFKAGFVGRLGARLAGGPAFVVTAHNHVLFRDDTPASTKRRYRLVERSLAGMVTSYIAVSNSVARELVEGYGLPADKVTTIRNSIDPAPFLAPQDRAGARLALGVSDDDTLVVGLAARFSAQKGLRHLIGAAPLLRDALHARGRGFVAVIGGSGPLESELREHAAALDATGSLRWPGHVADVAVLLGALDIYVSPAETEALGIGLIEAAIAGVPTVATNVGGVPEVVVDGETGILVAPCDPGALAAAVLSLAENPARAAQLAEAARARCLVEFAPARMIERTLDVYAAAVAQRRADR